MKRNIRVVAALVVAFLCAAGSLSGIDGEAATTYKYSINRHNGVSVFKISSLKLKGVCCQNNVKPKSGKATIRRLSNTSSHAKIAYYWGVVKGYDKKGPKSDEARKLTRMSQYLTSPKSVKNFGYVKSGKCKKDIKKALKVKVPDTFLIYRANPTNKSQDFIAWRNMSPSRLTLKKSSTIPAISSAGGYTFAGITYQVYKSDKKTKVGVLTCKANGTTNTLTGLVKGTYYAKEQKTNGYYAYNSAWLKVTVGEGALGTFYAKDAPLKGKVRLTKGSTDSNSVSAGYTFAGIQYGIFAAKSTEGKRLGILTLDRAGRSNLSGDLPIGTHYIREIKTNAWYRLSTTWYTVTVKSGKVTELGANQVKDVPLPGTVTIVKKISDGEKTGEEFTFELVNKNKSGISYRNIKVRGDGVPKKLNLLAGTYVLRETDSGEYIDETGDQDVLVRPGAEIVIERVNRMSKYGTLLVRKTTDDSGSRAGFRFRVTGVLLNQGTLTEVDLLDAAAPKAYSDPDGARCEAGPWEVDEEDLLALNRAAEQGKTGSYRVKVRGEALVSGATGGAIPLEREVVIHLKSVVWDTATRSYKAPVNRIGSKTALEGPCRVESYDLEWCGSATRYRDPDTGADHTFLVTDNRGYGINESTGEDGIDHISLGEYTVTEEMTAEQSARYLQPRAQTALWDGQGVSAFCFDFVNEAKPPLRTMPPTEPSAPPTTEPTTSPTEPATSPPTEPPETTEPSTPPPATEPTTEPSSPTVTAPAPVTKPTEPPRQTKPAPTTGTTSPPETEPEPASEPSSTPGKTEPPPTTAASPPDKNTRTGDDARIGLFLFMSALAGAGILLVLGRRKRI